VRTSVKSLIPMLAASLLLCACGSSSSSSSGGAAAQSQAASPSSSGGSASATIKTASNSAIGEPVLVTAQGLTLYHLSGERGGRFICTSSPCLHVWHPLTVTVGNKPSGSVGSLGVVRRPDGTEQVTYKGMPLYTFVRDTAPGDAHGQGIKDVGTWSAVTVSGQSGSAPASAATSSTSATQMYGY